MNAAFEPIGDRARWRIVFDLLTAVNPGELVTYDELGAALDLDGESDRHAIQMAMRRAGLELERTQKHAVEAVPNQGYRVVVPVDHMRLAKQHQGKSRRSLARGQSKVVNVDLAGMEPDQRRAFELVAAAFAAQADFNRRMDVRQAGLERAVASLTESSDRTAEELEVLRRRLDALGG